MNRWLKWSPLLLVVIIAVSGGSLWTHQVIAERLAHSSFSGADTSLQTEIQLALHDGLSPIRVQPYQSKFDVIVSEPAPNDKTFWSGTTAGFYAHETATLRSLDKQLHFQLWQSTRQAKQRVEGLLTLYQHAIGVAKAHGLGTKKFVTRLAGRQYQLAHASTVGGYRKIALQLRPHLIKFRHKVHARLADMHGIIHIAFASPRHLVAVRSIIRQRATSDWAELDLLRQFGKYGRLSHRLGTLEGWAFGRSHIKGAAIGAADLQTLGKAIHVKLKKAAPAKWILVSTEDETMRWFQGPTQIGYTLVTTGNPELPTVTGHFQIFAKFSPFTFVSPEPEGSPDWYEPSPVSYAMEFQSAGYYIHDSPWRTAYGPGTDGYGQPGTNYGGSHGCVNVPYDAMAGLYAWAPIGTTVVVD